MTDVDAEHVLAPWTQRLHSGRAACLAGTDRRESRLWIRVVLNTPVSSAGSRQLIGSDSDNESDDESDAEAKEPFDRPRCVAEWLLLLQALSSTDVARVIETIPRVRRATIAQRETRQGFTTQEEDKKDGIGAIIEGSPSDVRTVLELLSIGRDSLSAEFKQAHESIGTSSRKTMKLRVKLRRPSRPEDTAALNALAAALRDWGRYYAEHDRDEAAITLDPVDYNIGDFGTLAWLAVHFPTASSTSIGRLTCSGDLGPIASLESAVTKLFCGDQDCALSPPRVASLVLQNPLDAATFRVFCSAVRTAQSLKTLVVDSVLQDYGRAPEARTQRWKEFVTALFGPQASHNVQRVEITEWALLPEDVRAVEEVVSAAGVHNNALKIASLRLKIGGIQGGSAAPLAQLLRALHRCLPHLAQLDISVTDDPVINDAAVLAAVESFAPTLSDLSLNAVELDSIGSLLSVSTDPRLRLHSLQLSDLFVADQASFTPFFELLGDRTNPSTRHLQRLHIGLSKRHALDVRRFLVLIKAVLERNPRIIDCVVRCHGSFNFAANLSVKNFLLSIHDQPTFVPVSLANRAAFLSVFEQDDQPQEKRLRTERPSRFPQLHQDTVALIFAFAARPTKRIATVTVDNSTL